MDNVEIKEKLSRIMCGLNFDYFSSESKIVPDNFYVMCRDNIKPMGTLVIKGEWSLGLAVKYRNGSVRRVEEIEVAVFGTLVYENTLYTEPVTVETFIKDLLSLNNIVSVISPRTASYIVDEIDRINGEVEKYAES